MRILKGISNIFMKVGAFNKTLIKILREVLDNIVKEEAKEFLGFQPKTIELIVKGRRFNAMVSLNVDIPLTLLKRKQPIEMVANLYPELKKPSFHLEIMNPSGKPYSYTHPEWIKEFDKFWKRSSKRLEANHIVKTLRVQYDELVRELKKIREELETRIQQQW